MILADTNIIIDFWKYPIPVKREIFEHQEVAICPVVKLNLFMEREVTEKKEKYLKRLAD